MKKQVRLFSLLALLAALVLLFSSCDLAAAVEEMEDILEEIDEANVYEDLELIQANEYGARSNWTPGRIRSSGYQTWWFTVTTADASDRVLIHWMDSADDNGYSTPAPNCDVKVRVRAELASGTIISDGDYAGFVDHGWSADLHANGGEDGIFVTGYTTYVVEVTGYNVENFGTFWVCAYAEADNSRNVIEDLSEPEYSNRNNWTRGELFFDDQVFYYVLETGSNDDEVFIHWMDDSDNDGTSFLPTADVKVRVFSGTNPPNTGLVLTTNPGDPEGYIDNGWSIQADAADDNDGILVTGYTCYTVEVRGWNSQEEGDFYVSAYIIPVF